MQIHDKEMLAVIRALRNGEQNWKDCNGKTASASYTDHRALEYFMSTKKLNARQARWAEFLSRFYFIIRYRPGKQNPLADALSRHASEGIDMAKHRMQILLKPECLEEEINRFTSNTGTCRTGTDLVKCCRQTEPQDLWTNSEIIYRVDGADDI